MRTVVSAAKQQTTGRHARRPLVPSTRSAVGLQRTLGNEAVQHLMESEMRAPGEPLAPSVRADMEARFGADFGAVRVHIGAEAARSTAAVHANAYTVGRDITFASGEYAPHTATGRHLLAHELAHVVQQSRGGPTPDFHSAGHLEADAAQAAAAVAHGNGAVEVAAASGVGMARQEKNTDDPKARKKPKLPIGQSDVPGPAPWWTPLDFSQPLKLGSDVQLQNLGPTQSAWVPRAIQPFATLEATGLGLLQSTTDPRQGWTGQGGGQLQARFTFNPNLELGFGGSYGGIATLGGQPLLGPNRFGSAFLSLHLSEAQPHIPDDNEISEDEQPGTFRGAGFFAQGGTAFYAGPAGETGWFLSGTGAYSWVWPSGFSAGFLPEFLQGVVQGVDVNAGAALSRYGQVSGVNIGDVLMPFASVNFSLPNRFNAELYGNLPVGLGGNLSDPTASGTPLSLRLGAGVGWQIPLGDYALGIELGGIGEFANVRVPGVPGAHSVNFMPWLNIGVGAINRRVDFGNPGAFPSRF